ncbi:MAG: hypothetical protein JWM20_73 [Patescibacteria group bacterium]|nr:hypothetical protein [Patescibacteria group bacterium]
MLSKLRDKGSVLASLEAVAAPNHDLSVDDEVEALDLVLQGLHVLVF